MLQNEEKINETYQPAAADHAFEKSERSTASANPAYGSTQRPDILSDHVFGKAENSETATTAVNYQYKARLFEMIFSHKEELLELYNAVNNSHYTDPSSLEVNTLKNALYMAMHNDISFILDTCLSLYEHQSTYNPNLPLRFLEYIADLYSTITKDDNLYGRRQIQIPAPRFIIFYNGQEEQPDRKLLKLSGMYTVKEDHPSLELEAVMLNINRGHNSELMQACKTLADYAEFTARVREYAEQLPIADAVERAVSECIKENILTPFLRNYRAEAIKMSIYEYDEEKHMRQERQESFAEGLREGLAEGKAEGRKEGRASGRLETLYQLVMKGLLSLKAAAGEADQTEDVFLSGMNAYIAAGK